MRQHALSVLRPARDKFFASLVFIREWARSPRAMGQVCPSGTPLARSMAACVPLPAPVGPDGLSELVVELGAGTGTVTQELLRRGVHPHRLLVLERSEGMVELLRQRFPGLRVVHGDAAEVTNRLSTAQPQYLDVVPLTLEEIFIYELGGADYAVKDILL